MPNGPSQPGGRRLLQIGTRGSTLALTQTTMVIDLLHAAQPALQFAPQVLHTQGDRDRHSPLAQIGGQGIFVRELEAALLDGRIDFAVHSLKDMPSTLPDGLTLAAVPARGDVRDALVSRDSRPLTELPSGARVGTGSRRRRAELLALRPDLEPVEVRGNVDTRIQLVRSGAVAAVVLAVAGLERLGRLAEVAQLFAADELLPATGQGALALETRAASAELCSLAAAIDDADTHTCVNAERAFLRRLGGGCTTPAGAYCIVEDAGIRLRGLVADASGRLYRAELRGAKADAEALGAALAEVLIGQGAPSAEPSLL